VLEPGRGAACRDAKLVWGSRITGAELRLREIWTLACSRVRSEDWALASHDDIIDMVASCFLYPETNVRACNDKAVE
jgi:hypothetical protein